MAALAKQSQPIYRHFHNKQKQYVVKMTGEIMEEEFIQPAVVSEITGLTASSLAQLRYNGTGPRFYKPTPRTVLYKRSEVIEWVEASARQRTDARAIA